MLLFLMFLRIRMPNAGQDNQGIANDMSLKTEHHTYEEEKISFTKCLFNKCYTIGSLFDDSCGGAICAVFCDVSVSKCSFNLNKAVFAGCICSYDGTMVIIQSNFTNSISINDVGAVWSMTNQTGYTKPSLWINESSFINNSAGRYYGAVASNHSNPVMYKCEFVANNAREAVGALGIITFSSTYLIDLVFINNTSQGSYRLLKCPALYIQGSSNFVTSNIFITKCYFNNNNGIDNIPRAFTTFGQINLCFFDYLCFDGTISTLYEYIEHPGLRNPENVHLGIGSIKECRYFLPTAGFSQSIFFLPSNQFSSSIQFSSSNQFSPSKKFSLSQSFTPEATKYSEDSSKPILSEYSQEDEEMKTPIQAPATNEDNDWTNVENTKEPDQKSPSLSESSKSEEDKNEEEDTPLSMPALAGGLGILLIIIIIIIIVICCCCKKKGGGVCSKIWCCCSKKEIVHEEINTKNIIMLPRVDEHDGEYADYINPFHVIHEDSI